MSSSAVITRLGRTWRARSSLPRCQLPKGGHISAAQLWAVFLLFVTRCLSNKPPLAAKGTPTSKPLTAVHFLKWRGNIHIRLPAFNQSSGSIFPANKKKNGKAQVKLGSVKEKKKPQKKKNCHVVGGLLLPS